VIKEWTLILGLVKNYIAFNGGRTWISCCKYKCFSTMLLNLSCLCPPPHYFL